MLVFCAALVVSALLSGCVSTVGGTALRGDSADLEMFDVPTLTESDLDRVLLTAGEVNGIMGATGIRMTASSQNMSDNSDGVSDVDCLAAIYGAEQMVYQGSGWSAVRDQVLQEPTTDNEHWVEQIAVLYPSSEKATAFVEKSRTTWQKCGGTSIDIDNSDVHSTWRIDTADVSGDILTQVSTQRNAGGWGCQHALTSASNVVVEAWACSNSIDDEARAIAADMIKNAAKK
ncbi:sensor domain-containing protein [Mycolicibacterium aichiense]|uniref:Sensor domain-containing protein n=1 Tax=Mycolicibacterium aichiense TaxID=1799 RepID=A0AAD1HTA7_9MYCO|nr:sensor domain-containing protein [Mycolicibacterium aichiense]MCV7018267.1 sensor domain-containing protein [Mycolicibacterium aichiense]BBX08751.1 sensor domain-containing protein [Mycolicibacterium aichiense]STZ82544.1 serine/threonine protein kinase [Mycolicibacterium aichiense]